MNTIQEQLNDALAQFIGQTNTADTKKALLAIARQIVPDLLAKDIIGVQQMDTGVFYAPYIPLQFYERDAKVFAKKPMHFSRTKWYRATIENNWDNALDWCKTQFGNPPKNPDAWTRWYYSGIGGYVFRDERDYIMFTLRWS